MGHVNTSGDPVALCSLDELRREKRVTRWIEQLRDEIMAVFVGGNIRVMSAICPHFGGAFDYDVKRGEFVCQWHKFRFDAQTGRCRMPQSKMQLQSYSFDVHEGMIWVRP